MRPSLNITSRRPHLFFGFSRGAYTARCVGAASGLCGIPTQSKDGVALPRYGKALRAIADEAVAKVYEHGSGKDDADGVYEKERLEKARRFRAQCASGNELESNAAPYLRVGRDSCKTQQKQT